MQLPDYKNINFRDHLQRFLKTGPSAAVAANRQVRCTRRVKKKQLAQLRCASFSCFSPLGIKLFRGISQGRPHEGLSSSLPFSARGQKGLLRQARGGRKN